MKGPLLRGGRFFGGERGVGGGGAVVGREEMV